MLSDEEARRIEAQLPSADPAVLARWVKALLEDRRGRNAIVLGQTRRLVPCPHCGAPVSKVRTEQGAQGHAIVHDHPNGSRCEDRQHLVGDTAPKARPTER